jgi:hypothetical protein
MKMLPRKGIFELLMKAERTIYTLLPILFPSKFLKSLKSRYSERPDVNNCAEHQLEGAGKLDESASRIIGNFFLSINMSIGLTLLLLYFLLYESMCANQWIPLSIS